MGRTVGHKIGCTTRVMQTYLGISNPCGGAIFEQTLFEDGATIDHTNFVRLGVECELGVRLSGDLTSAIDHRSARRAIASCFAAIELVDERYADYRTLGAATLIADNFFGAGCVLGPEDTAFDPMLLDRVRAGITINGRPAGEGSGRDILSHPLDAFIWLAENVATRGKPLRAGEFVLLGSVVQTQWLVPGDRVAIENEKFGTIGFTLG